MKWTTPWRVLIGNREAILEAAGTRWTLLVGAILVLSASLARKYDTVDLLAEPYELLHGLAAVMVNAMGLHLLFWMLGSARPRPPFWSTYLSFLGVFMLAAPMGWVYGVPYEQFLTAPDAVSANLQTLAVVSVVRLVWMTRVLNVLWGVEGNLRRVGTFFAMMVYCDAVAIVALVTAPIPTFDIMGGLQQPEEVRIVAATAFWARIIALLTGPIWLLIGLVALRSIKRRWNLPATHVSELMPRGAVLVSIVAAVAWVSLLPFMQKPTQNRTRFESLLAAGRTGEAVHDLYGRARDEYPPVWSPPPRVESQEWELANELPAIARAIRAEAHVSPWVDEAYGKKMILWCDERMGNHWTSVTGARHYAQYGPGNGPWVTLSEFERVKAFRGTDKSQIAAIRTCLEFIRDRMKSLTNMEFEEVDRWLNALATHEAEEQAKATTGK